MKLLAKVFRYISSPITLTFPGKMCKLKTFIKTISGLLFCATRIMGGKYLARNENPISLVYNLS